jgi:Protein of unknown function (DUF1822)
MIADILTLTDTNHLWLEIPETTIAKAWQQTRTFATPSTRWQAYLNQLALATLLPWLKEENNSAKVSSKNAWELFNGTSIETDDFRLVLVPTTAIDLEEIRVPQEWLDLPSLAADYYLAVEVNPDEAYIRVYGYSTHTIIKNKGTYDALDRTYSLERENLIADLNVLWLSRQLCPTEVLKNNLVALPSLAATQAQNLVDRLGNMSLVIPRLEVPFTIWGALLENDNWRQALINQRQGRQSKQWSVSNWLESGIVEAAKQVGWKGLRLQTNTFRGAAVTSQLVGLSRQLTIEGNAYELRILAVNNKGEGVWRFELRHATIGKTIPQGYKLRLLTDIGEGFEGNEDVATKAEEQLYIEVALNPAEGLIWEVEPQPDNYSREVLRF